MYFFALRLLKRVLLTLVALAGVAATSVHAQPSPAGPSPVRVALIESLSGPFANTGEAVFRNLAWAAERVMRAAKGINRRGESPAGFLSV